MPKIVVSYRRSDTTAIAGRIRDRLVNYYGEQSIFMDIDNIPFGTDYREHINAALGHTDVLLVVLGPKWLGPGKEGDLRIMDPDDPVRLEIETALNRGIPIVPLLIGTARMPKPDQLPESIRDLAFRNCPHVDTGANFSQDMDRLIRSLQSLTQAPARSPITSPPPMYSPTPASPPPRTDKRNTPKEMKGPTEAALSAIQDALNVRDPAPASEPPWRTMRTAPAKEVMFEDIEVRYSEDQGRLEEAPEARKEAVEFSVSHPRAVGGGVPFIVDAWVALPKDRTEVVQRAKELLSGAAIRSVTAVLARGTELTVRLEIDPWTVEPEYQTIVWTGEVANVSFRISPTASLPNAKACGACKFYMNGLRIGHVFFEVNLGSTATQPTAVTTGKSVRSAFVSYATRDRRRVLDVVKGIEKAGVNVFMDVRNLRSNDPYKSLLFEHIQSADVLYLFWSKHAKNSIWVDQEWRYGMQNKGLEFIDPVPLVDPRKVPPPPELADEKHFNDWTLAYRDYEKSLSVWSRFREWVAGD